MHYYPSPAKINRMLRVIRREANGYHYLQTIFQFTDLYDEIGYQITEQPEITFLYSHSSFPKEEDLIYRAIMALKKATHCQKGVVIDLIKNLPMGAGIGGGSSNAATTLIVLNRLWELNLSMAKLIEIGSQLGADVPIFIYGKSAWGEGIGEKLTPLSLPEEHFLMINPGIHISTKVIFESPFLPRDSTLMSEYYFDQSRAINDCLPAIYHHYPKMEQIVEQLTALDLDPYITGTGSCLYIKAPMGGEADTEKYQKLKELATQSAWQLLPFQSRNLSPLYSVAPQLMPD
ncbi:4-(cytidine 5'-diphospho)-2-C-methyl-D-erythritol kinase [Ignatzschineria cameli]|uniref:4-diphosphocytidyl-2-C-methyl-D-erythritol kinase n=1 Tax=Ignatzschineria cameli TaxID=2182793 RepID=A0A2U2AU36_9GAMM|nr:4-(cytidine 5'-diphospho)-2-C-methyl-D-erythritol kinase [Ignatzschineria cameli]PWD88234.1 4-(cytidine 5'-diphospho)-2-C-methyl-D-erythritol kinase [Ignatzschineria cameli]PWD91263.1 4-(cytidine 5'-diphospho)-2-C-methyl-D-erythritol kinase [Ignatzschineria cameli]PWD92904.1 4-(cytidine 5'-diphospho)-2-C-methyl-D-erythritol kinase [Ignatzschineria cameli]PWD93925.1 4-(cytidine 5'-diphospho)-2-C-methyl-D-erythritol kinase [Ignatzschineria cameli]